MSNMRMKHKLIMSMMAGMIIIPGSVVRTQAAETDDSEKLSSIISLQQKSIPLPTLFICMLKRIFLISVLVLFTGI